MVLSFSGSELGMPKIPPKSRAALNLRFPNSPVTVLSAGGPLPCCTSCEAVPRSEQKQRRKQLFPHAVVRVKDKGELRNPDSEGTFRLESLIARVRGRGPNVETFNIVSGWGLGHTSSPVFGGHQI